MINRYFFIYCVSGRKDHMLYTIRDFVPEKRSLFKENDIIKGRTCWVTFTQIWTKSDFLPCVLADLLLARYTFLGTWCNCTRFLGLYRIVTTVQRNTSEISLKCLILSERSLTTSGVYLSRNATLIPSDYLFNNCRYHNHRPCVRLPHRLPWKSPFKHSLPRVKFSARDWTLNQEIQRKGYTKVLLLICPEKMQDLHAI